jgi:hypothetical protein
MTDLARTQHAITRLAQRGIKLDDIPFIMAFGTEVTDGFLVREKDVRAIEHSMKAFVQRLRLLQGKRIVTRDGCLITGFHASEKQARKLLCRNDQRSY